MFSTLTHKFQNATNLLDDIRFSSKDSILRIDSPGFEPKCLIIGTFNPDWPGNEATFFYSRSRYFWKIMSNVFTHGDWYHDVRTNVPAPTHAEMAAICLKTGMVFADLIKGTVPDAEVMLQPNGASVNGYPFSGMSDAHLSHLGNQGWLDTNSKAIVDYLNNNRSICYVYFTFNSQNWLVNQKHALINEINGFSPDIEIGTIFTPTGQGLGANMARPYHTRLRKLTHHWLWVNRAHAQPIHHLGYTHLNHRWVIDGGGECAPF
jgi:hypothetical protein